MKFTEAEEQLVFAEDFLERVRNSESHQEFKKWWQAYRTCIATAINSLKNQLLKGGFLKGNHFHQMIKRAEGQPELQYVLQARHSSFHSIDPVSEVIDGYIYFYIPEPPEVEVRENGAIIAPAHSLKNIGIVSPRIKLIPVSNRGRIYLVPMCKTDSGDVTEHDPMTLGSVAISQVRKTIQEFEKTTTV